MHYCGYSVRNDDSKNKINFKPIKTINVKKTYNSHQIHSCFADDFAKNAVYFPSKYNLPKINTLVTTCEAKNSKNFLIRTAEGSKDGQNSLNAFSANAEKGSNINSDMYAIYNIMFPQGNTQKTIQFMCIDGKNLEKYEIENASHVIDMINNNKVPIYSVKSNSLDAIDMHNMDGYACLVLFFMMLYNLIGNIDVLSFDVVAIIVNTKNTEMYWNGSYFNFCKYDDTFDGKVSVNRIGHELCHAVIENAGGLVYTGETGSINESISNLFGEYFRKYVKLMCMNIDAVKEFASEKAIKLKSFSNPKSISRPNTIKGSYWINSASSLDDGGIHINSSVCDFAFFLMVNGGSGINDYGLQYNITSKISMYKLFVLIYGSLFGISSSNNNSSSQYNKMPKICLYRIFFRTLLSNASIIDNSPNKLHIRQLVIDVANAVGINLITEKEQNESYPEIDYISHDGSSDSDSDKTTITHLSNTSDKYNFTRKNRQQTMWQHRSSMSNIPTPKSTTLDMKTTEQQVKCTGNANCNKFQQMPLPTPRHCPITVINFADTNAAKYTVKGVAYTMNNILMCYNGTEIDANIFLAPTTFNGLELDILCENETSTIIVNTLYYGSVKTNNKKSFIIQQSFTPSFQTHTITLPRTKNAKCVSINIVTHGTQSKFKSLTLGKY